MAASTAIAVAVGAASVALLSLCLADDPEGDAMSRQPAQPMPEAAKKETAQAAVDPGGHSEPENKIKRFLQESFKGS